MTIIIIIAATFKINGVNNNKEKTYIQLGEIISNTKEHKGSRMMNQRNSSKDQRNNRKRMTEQSSNMFFFFLRACLFPLF